MGREQSALSHQTHGLLLKLSYSKSNSIAGVYIAIRIKCRFPAFTTSPSLTKVFGSRIFLLLILTPPCLMRRCAPLLLDASPDFTKTPTISVSSFSSLTVRILEGCSFLWNTLLHSRPAFSAALSP